VLDHLGAGFTLMRVGEAPPDAAALVDAATRRGLPLTVLDLPEPRAAELFAAPLLLVRPDQHVAWRGAELPPDPERLVDQVRGARLYQEAGR
jgi:hypothetical protein